MSDFAKDTGTGNFQRVYMTPDESSEAEHTAEGAIKEGRVRTEEENFKAQHGIQIQEKPQEEEQPQEEGLLAGKYKSAEDLEKAYLELQTKLGKGEEPTKEETQQVESTDISEDLFLKGYNEWSQNGDISPATLQEFVSKGIPEQYVRQYVEGANAQIQLMTMEVYNKMGGEQHVQEIMNWAADNLTDEEIQTYNDLIDSGDINKTITAYQSIEARMGNQTQNRFIKPEQGTAKENGGFQSKAEMIEAMNDPRYRKDPAYRSQVERRLARSKNL